MPITQITNHRECTSVSRHYSYLMCVLRTVKIETSYTYVITYDGIRSAMSKVIRESVYNNKLTSDQWIKMICKFLWALTCSIFICSHISCLRSPAKALTVTSALDQPSPGELTLREAIDLAKSGDCVNFAAHLDASTINITRALDIPRAVIITTEGLRNGITVRGTKGKNPLFRISGPNSTVTLNRLTISGGGPGIMSLPGTNLNIMSCVVDGSDNMGIAFSGHNLALSGTTCRRNGSEGLSLRATGKVSIAKSSFIDNAGGGLIAFAPQMNISFCRVEGNRGIHALEINGAQVNVDNSIVKDNNSFRTLSAAVGHSEGSAVLQNCTISRNVGGGISNTGGTMRLYRCLITGNMFSRSTDHLPSAILNENARMFIEGSTVAGNTSVTGPTIAVIASAIQSGVPASNLTMRYCTISGNHVTEPNPASGSSGIECDTVSGFNSVNVIVDNCTISGNTTAGRGGAIGFLHSGGTSLLSGFTLTATTITENRAAVAGGIYVAPTPLNSLEMGMCIVAWNKDDGELEPDVSGSFLSQGYNLIRNGAGCEGPGESDLVGQAPDDLIDPLLAPLADNGGLTLTHMPMAGSPAINSGDPNYARQRDQTGRVRGVRSARGSVEAYGSGPTIRPIGLLKSGKL